MKKNYINPELQVFKLVISQPLLDASVQNLGGEANAETTGFGRISDFDGDWE